MTCYYYDLCSSSLKYSLLISENDELCFEEDC